MLRICMAGIRNADRLLRNHDGVWYRKPEPVKNTEVYAAIAGSYADCTDHWH